MVTPELADFVRIELERKVSEAEITSKLISAGWLKEDVAEALTQNKIPLTSTQNIVQPKESVQLASAQVKSFDPYRESPVGSPTTSFSYKAPTTADYSENSPVLPELIPKSSIGYMQNVVGKIEESPVKPEPASIPSLAEYQNKLEKIEVNQANIASSTPVTLPPKKSSHVIRTILFIVSILLIIGGLFYSYTKGYIKMPFEVPFLKKNPHQVLSEVPVAMSSVKTFKSDMDVRVSFPAVSSIIGMVMGGEANTTTNTDSINLNTDISFDDTDKNNRKIDATFISTSSLIDQAVTLNLRSINDVSYIKVSDIQKLVPIEASVPLNWVSISKNDLDLIYTMAKNNNQKVPSEDNKNAIVTFLSSFNLSNILSSLPIDSNTVIKENPSVLVAGVDTYHYSISVDKAMVNKIIHSLGNSYGLKITDSDWVEVDKVISSAQVNTFDVWIGKSDSLLYKIDLEILLPLNKVLNLEDKNLSENTLKLKFINNYHDYNSPLIINAPEESTSILQVFDAIDKTTKDNKMKDTMLTLTNAFGKMHDLEKIYGYKSNLGGSCANPTYGSLFSPTGHKKSTADTVSTIAKSIILFMGMAGDKAVCYSTPYAWAISAPLTSDNSKYYCVDNSGVFIESTLPLSGTVCK